MIAYGPWYFSLFSYSANVCGSLQLCGHCLHVHISQVYTLQCRDKFAAIKL